MLLAIDVGNTHTVFGLWDGSQFVAIWRRSTQVEETEDELAAWLKGLFDLQGIAFIIEGAICASVVPPINYTLQRLAEKWFKVPLLMLDGQPKFGLKIDFQPVSSIGPDRLANAIGALDKWPAPLVVVDFGTATTFDVVDASGAYIGGAILPGILVSTEALVSRTSRLPAIEFKAPERAIGRSTVEAIQSGVILGYGGAIDTLARKIREELGGTAKVVATGGLGGLFTEICDEIELYDAEITLRGLQLAWSRTNGV